MVLALSLTHSPGRAKMSLRKRSISAFLQALVSSHGHSARAEVSMTASVLCSGREFGRCDVITALEVTLSERIIFLTSLFWCSVLPLFLLNMLFGVANQCVTTFYSVHKSNWRLFLESALYFLLLAECFLLSEMLFRATCGISSGLQAPFNVPSSNKSSLISPTWWARFPFLDIIFAVSYVNRISCFSLVLSFFILVCETVRSSRTQNVDKSPFYLLCVVINYLE